MQVDILSIRDVGYDDAGKMQYDIPIRVDGIERTLRLVQDADPRSLGVVSYADKLHWDLFADDQFYIAAIPRLLLDVLAGAQREFPFRLVEAGPGAHYFVADPGSKTPTPPEGEADWSER